MIIQTKNYKIIVDEDINSFTTAISWLDYSSIFVCVDENTFEHCLEIIKNHIPSKINLIIIPPGESHKTLITCQYIWKQLVEKNADRRSLLLNLGGGVVGDMAGFCAGTFMRGIDFVQVPTTLLSQVDASVGGKLGIDFMGFKNMIGAFKDPILVYVHPPFLKTLPHRELISGYAEVIKHSIVYSHSFWQELTSRMVDLDYANADWASIISQAIAIKHKVVSEDPFEKGIRKILNFGHSIGHAIESERFGSENPLTHGEAIAIGMICESYISFKKSHLSKEKLHEIETYIRKFFAKETLENRKAIVERMKGDKKNFKGKN